MQILKICQHCQVYERAPLVFHQLVFAASELVYTWYWQYKTGEHWLCQSGTPSPCKFQFIPSFAGVNCSRATSNFWLVDFPQPEINYLNTVRIIMSPLAQNVYLPNSQYFEIGSPHTIYSLSVVLCALEARRHACISTHACVQSGVRAFDGFYGHISGIPNTQCSPYVQTHQPWIKLLPVFTYFLSLEVWQRHIWLAHSRFPFTPHFWLGRVLIPDKHRLHQVWWQKVLRFWAPLIHFIPNMNCLSCPVIKSSSFGKTWIEKPAQNPHQSVLDVMEMKGI